MSGKYELGRSRMHIRNRTTGETVFRDVNTIDSASYSFEESTLSKQSTNEVSGEVARKTQSMSGTLSVVFGSTEYKNFLLAARARASTQGATTQAATFTYPALKVGEAFKLPHVNITDISIPGKVEEVDYTVFKASGLVHALTDNTIPIDDATYSAGLAKRAAIAAEAAQEYEVVFTDVLSGESTTLYRWAPTLPKNVNLVNINEFTTYEVEGGLLVDTTKPAAGDMGQFGVKYEISA